jgi:hypothetical protein
LIPYSEIETRAESDQRAAGTETAQEEPDHYCAQDRRQRLPLGGFLHIGSGFGNGVSRFPISRLSRTGELPRFAFQPGTRVSGYISRRFFHLTGHILDRSFNAIAVHHILFSHQAKI